MAAISVSLAASLLWGFATAQMPGIAADTHPKLNTWKCTFAGGCVQQNTSIVFDASSHWIHQKADSNLGCGAWGSAPNKTICPDAATCQQNCVMEGITDYSAFGITTEGDALDMHLLREDGTTNALKLYLLNEGTKEYEMLKLGGNEFSFDVDVSKLPCGLNGALYLSEMAANGGKSALNTGGAAYGTGYCDAQCSVTPFINGVGNIDAKGSCCNQVDIWKANSEATLMAPYACNITGQYLCSGAQCATEGVCDKNGCGWNPYIMGDRGFYGSGETFHLDTTRPFTVVTQFPLENGVLKRVYRLYVQDGQIIQNAAINVTGLPEISYMDDALCSSTGASRYTALGGTKSTGAALARGMVLVFSIWWDESGFMNWLDSGNAGPCNATEGNPSVIRKVEGDPSVRFSAIKWGEIGSTYEGIPPEEEEEEESPKH